MAKKKWYKDIWAWAGLLLYMALLFVPSFTFCSGTQYTNGFCATTMTNIIKFPFGTLLSNPQPMGAGLPFNLDLSGGLGTLILNPIFYFIVGLGIHALFRKLKWVRK